jgi:hypothetical protein
MAAEETPPTPSRPPLDRRGRKKGGNRNGNARLSPEERKLRGEMIVAKRLAGKRMGEIADEFRISEATAYRALNEATRSGLLEKARDFVGTVLLPKALAVYEQALDNMDVEVARDVLQGLGITGRRVQVETKHTVSEDFDAWRLKKASKLGLIVDAETVQTADSSRAPLPGDGLPLQLGDGAGGDPDEAAATDLEPLPGEPGVAGEGFRTPGDGEPA